MRCHLFLAFLATCLGLPIDDKDLADACTVELLQHRLTLLDSPPLAAANESQVLGLVAVREWDLAVKVGLDFGLLPVAVLLALALLPLVGFCIRRRGALASRKMQDVWVLQGMTINFPFATGVLDSFGLCSNLGMSQAASGQVMGFFWNGSIVSILLAWALVRWHPEHWRRHHGPLMLATLFPQLLCALFYVYVAVVAETPADRPGLARVLYVFWTVNGFSVGWSYVFTLSAMMHVVSPLDRGTFFARWTLSGLLGFGLGPLISGALHALDVGHPAPRYTLAGYMMLVTALGTLGLCAATPSFEDATDYLVEVEAASAPNGRRHVVLCCMLVSCLRNCSMSAMELGIALALEDIYGWSKHFVGLFSGLAFMACLLAQSVHEAAGRLMSAVSWIRITMLLTIPGVLLLFKVLKPYLGVARLLAATPMLLSLPFLTDMACTAFLYQHIMPKGTSVLDSDNTSTIMLVLQCLSRFSGNWLGRLLLERYGEDAFALGQLGLNVLIVLVFECFIQPSLAPGVLALLEKQRAREAAGAALLETASEGKGPS